MGTRKIHWDPIDDCVITETDGIGNTIVTYTHEPGPFGPLLSESRTGTEFYHHYDALGSTAFLTNDSGTVTDTFQYDAWGNSVARTGSTPTPYRWVGRWRYQFDTPTGGFYVRARTYQPTIARWVSSDPRSRQSVIAAHHIFRSYDYGSSSPIRKIDPTLLADEDCCCFCAVSAKLDRIRKLNHEMDGFSYFGHTFTHSSALMRIVSSLSTAKCRLEWWECSTAQTTLMRENNIPPLQWFEGSVLDPSSPVFENWEKYYDGKAPFANLPCPSPGFTVDARDDPETLVGLSRVLWFAIIIKSGTDCPCDIASITKYGTQILKSEDGNITTQAFELGLQTVDDVRCKGIPPS